MNVENVHSSGYSPVSQIATHILCILSGTVSSPALNSSHGTSSAPVALRLAVWRMAWATSERSGGGSFSQYSGSIPFPSSSWYKSSQYLFHQSAICASSVNFLPAADWIHCGRGWNFRVIDLTIWKSCLEFPFEFAASNSMHMPSSCCCLSTLSFLCTSAFSSLYQFLSLPFASLFSLIAAQVSLGIHFFFFCNLMDPGVSLATFAGLSWYLSGDLMGLPHPVQFPVL